MSFNPIYNNLHNEKMINKINSYPANSNISISNPNFMPEINFKIGNTSNMTNMSNMNNNNFYTQDNFLAGQGNFTVPYSLVQQQGLNYNRMSQDYNTYNNQNLRNRQTFNNNQTNFYD
jgi:hypothetical protein